MHLFDIVTQYRAIFSDDAFVAAAAAAASLSSSSDATAAPLSSSGGDAESASLLYSWLVQKVSAFLAQLRRHLPAVRDNFANLLDQCMYYGMSLGRVGCDFRSLLPPIFEEAIFTASAAGLARAVSRFEAALARSADTERMLVAAAATVAAT